MYREFTWHLSFGTLRGLEFNPGKSNHVIAIHGWLDNAASFIPLMQHIEESHVMAVDLAGHGHSDHRAEGAHYHLVDNIADVFELADAMGWQKFHLLGHSLGAGISSLMAASAPERVLSLRLIDGLGPVSGRDEDAVSRLRRSINARLRNGTKKPRRYDSVDAAVKVRLAATEMEESSARLIVERNLRKTEKGYYQWRTDRRVTHASPVYMSETLVRTFLSSIECPASLVLADHGVLRKLGTTPGRIEAFRDLTVIEHHGNHHLHMDDAAAIAPLLFPGEQGADSET